MVGAATVTTRRGLGIKKSLFNRQAEEALLAPEYCRSQAKAVAPSVWAKYHHPKPNDTWPGATVIMKG
jgi:hypothetical protein